ncbi:hypothetical protein K461DRAFT_12262 [Myriangium duriaei CBS 260.36]|uniref:Uncharacterized protein n=1 Tax=Myriangium duriaei CBS 260.36 TaxID=1168546 RepID=A0A9P4JDV9_9PEZI|nr:hypothetical protein K461DRAFT_12262 [Myriangium duriaei CBS 260.36]
MPAFAAMEGCLLQVGTQPILLGIMHCFPFPCSIPDLYLSTQYPLPYSKPDLLCRPASPMQRMRKRLASPPIRMTLFPGQNAAK